MADATARQVQLLRAVQLVTPGTPPGVEMGDPILVSRMVRMMSPSMICM